MSLLGTIRRFGLATAFAVCIGGMASTPVAAQSPTGPQTPAVKTPDVVRIPNNPGPSADIPAIPPDEIIRRFAEQEDEFARASSGFAARKSVRLDEMGGDGKSAGHAEVTTEPVVTADGARSQRPAGEPQSTLQILSLERDDLEALSKIPAFPLLTSELSNYQIVYQGRQPLDELTTYIFAVTPKQLSRARAYFSGLVWVDDHDLAIVKTYGKWVTETGDVTSGQLPFTIFETYRQPVANKYWLPAYSRSDSSVSRQAGNVAVRLIIRWDDYMPISAGNAAPGPAVSQSPSNPPR